ncbi:hypothetical protein T07_9919 [Trichinella nelsoni]|uniref:Uncharacterized protein n=1 Tax=Trichinella nelsoni TaxID=6336 RepID=A0A0V0S6N0_9BILA|nr:hypothetical protein T07_9919 [Trichinella nelsoni]
MKVKNIVQMEKMDHITTDLKVEPLHMLNWISYRSKQVIDVSPQAGAHLHLVQHHRLYAIVQPYSKYCSNDGCGGPLN